MARPQASAISLFASHRAKPIAAPTRQLEATKTVAVDPSSTVREMRGLNRLAALSTSAAHAITLAKVRAALESLHNEGTPSTTTLVQAGITLSQGTSSGPMAYAAAKAVAPKFGILA